MSVEQALRAGGATAFSARAQAHHATAAMLLGGITTRRRAAFFLAQLLHESAGLLYREEIASGEQYEGRADLGNTRKGDGRRFKGRGWIQLTGRNNYRAAGKALGLPLEANPELAAREDVAWRVAVWFWTSRGLNAVADRGAFVAVTKAINGGTNGLADRQYRLHRIEPIDARPTRAQLAPPGSTSRERRLVNEVERLRDGRKGVARRGEIKAWLIARANALVKDGHPERAGRGDRIEWLRDAAHMRDAFAR